MPFSDSLPFSWARFCWCSSPAPRRWRKAMSLAPSRTADGHPIKGATITAENPNASPSSATATTDAKGQFSFLGLRGGVWIFVVQAPGFEAGAVKSTTKTFGTNEAVPIVLQPQREISPPGPLTSLDVPALQRRLDDAAALEADGKVDEAIRMYRAIAADVPSLTMVHLELGILYERTSDDAAAATEYNTVLKTDPENPKARAGLERVGRK